MDSINQEKLEVLNGDRRRSRAQAAVRRADIKRLADLNQKSQPAAGTDITPDEYDALVNDVAAIMQALRTLGRL